ncbi:MAG: winged helix-turn-helix transcriptional regulator [Planctomycetes bacterium]|nr:winged helix-turn-helix transcriptional regulator [Planctomycetota bacterium]
MSSRIKPPSRRTAPAGGHSWTFLSNHAHVLVCLAGNPEQTLREVAARVGITERAVQKILADLEEEGLVTRERHGRRNGYDLHLDKPLRHPLESHRTVRELVDLATHARRSRVASISVRGQPQSGSARRTPKRRARR